MIQETVLVITAVLMAVVTGAFIFVAVNVGKTAEEYAPVQTKSYSLRSKFFWFLVVLGVVVTTITTVDLPYAATRGDIPEGAIQVNVEGRQWAWILDKYEANVGDTVIFNVTAVDVTHGLGVYDPEMHMIGQVQAMPGGYVNSLQLTFDKPGIYKLLCMEYCGLAHHGMISEFKINELEANDLNVNELVGGQDEQ